MLDTKIHLPQLHNPAERRIALRVSSNAERALRQGHPWLFADAIIKQRFEGKPGDLAVIFDSQRNFLAIGIYDPTSTIRVRILQHRKPATIDQGWFAERIKAAAQIRAALSEATNAYRLINGENDGLPGLVCDRYAQSLVVKIYSVAWVPHLPVILSILLESIETERIILRLGRDAEKYPEALFGLKNGAVIAGSQVEGPVCFQENGITFEADLIYGQKTGFFLDQRENRARVEKISQYKQVLNVFAYTGGFSLYAARGGAREVISLDQSRPALKAAKRNFLHNQTNSLISACQHQIIVGDAFQELKNLANAKEQFDIIIIDPPSFAKKQTETENALAAYQRLTRLGLAVLERGGILVQASCSSRVKANDFFSSIHQAAQQVRRPLKEIERTGHALDHPIRFPEGEYLKCLFAQA